MRSLAILVALAFLSLPVRADPSFSCTGQLNEAEATICAVPKVARLDSRMARAFDAALSGKSAAAQDRLRREQRAWLAYRDFCGRQADCLAQRYRMRLRTLTPQGAAAAPTKPIHRIRNGRFETVYPDGRIDWSALGGGSSGTDYPDGRKTQVEMVQVPGAGFPSLPGQYADWGTGLESHLLAIVDALLSPSDRTKYHQLEATRPFSERIFDHLNVISFLVEQN